MLCSLASSTSARARPLFVKLRATKPELAALGHPFRAARPELATVPMTLPPLTLAWAQSTRDLKT